ncbi:MAG: hypothetical protein NTW50_01395 [Candidatus Berkelbacteria bacterium]|nr:hypothetical protein [Candidatus Berkelbacteria bacterium]
MSLTEKDLKSIKGIVKEIVDDSIEQNNVTLIEQVKDVVDFAIEKSELKLTEKIENIASELSDFREEMNREISDLAETNHEFLAKFDDHDTRIVKLELSTKLAHK